MRLKSYKIRFYLLLGVIPLLILLSWKLALSQTVSLQSDLTRLKQNIRQYADPEQTLMQLSEEASLIREKDASDPLNVDEHLMDEISRNIGRFHIRLEEFPETHVYSSSTYRVKTFRLRFSGRYVNLLRFINYAEYEIASCSLVSVDFERREHRKTGEKLFVDLYFQSVYKAN